MAQNEAQQIFFEINALGTYIHACTKKKSPKNMTTSVIFIILTKVNDRPIGQKFAQSGHPAEEQLLLRSEINSIFKFFISRSLSFFLSRKKEILLKGDKMRNDVAKCDFFRVVSLLFLH
jgi:hypothetical protein